MRIRGAVLGLVLLAAAGCSAAEEEAAPPAPSFPNQVTVADRAYSPQSITINAGETVTWVFDDGGMAHDVVADDRSFRSPMLVQTTFSQTFDEPGTYSYHCTPHPDMTGTVVVV